MMILYKGPVTYMYRLIIAISSQLFTPTKQIILTQIHHERLIEIKLWSTDITSFLLTSTGNIVWLTIKSQTTKHLHCISCRQQHSSECAEPILQHEPNSQTFQNTTKHVDTSRY